VSRRFLAGLSIAILAVAAQGHAAAPNIAYKQPPTTDDEKAIAQVFETLLAKAPTDAQAAAALYTQDAVIHWIQSVFGQENEKVARGREGVSRFISARGSRIRSEEYRDVTMSAAGDRAEASGQVSYLVEAIVGRKGVQTFRIQEERSWKLRRGPEGWRIYEQEERNRTRSLQ
jgi:hypothetical protein